MMNLTVEKHRMCVPNTPPSRQRVRRSAEGNTWYTYTRIQHTIAINHRTHREKGNIQSIRVYVKQREGGEKREEIMRMCPAQRAGLNAYQYACSPMMHGDTRQQSVHGETPITRYTQHTVCGIFFFISFVFCFFFFFISQPLAAVLSRIYKRCRS